MRLSFKYILIVLLFSGFTFSQVIPSKFNLSDKKKLTKLNADPNPAGNSITDIIAVGDTVWVATGNGLSVSFDNGNSWKSFSGTPEFGTEDISALAYNNGVVWVATAHSENLNSENVDVGSGLKYTTDNGITWNSMPQPIDNQNDTTINYGINVIQALPVTVAQQNLTFDRSEERRVGKECRSRWSPYY